MSEQPKCRCGHDIEDHRDGYCYTCGLLRVGTPTHDFDPDMWDDE